MNAVSPYTVNFGTKLVIETTEEKRGVEGSAGNVERGLKTYEKHCQALSEM